MDRERDAQTISKVERERAYKRAWQHKNRDRLSAYNKEYYKERSKNPEFRSIRSKQNLESYHRKKTKEFEDSVMEIYRFIDERIQDTNFEENKDTYMVNLRKRFKIIPQQNS